VKEPDTPFCFVPSRPPREKAMARGVWRALERGHGGEDVVVSPRLFFERKKTRAKVAIGVSARVGVGYAGEDARLPLRFFDTESGGVSRPPKRAIGLGDARES